MRAVLIVVLLALLASCAPASVPPPKVVPQPKSAIGLAPLGPCPPSTWRPESPPPTASSKTSMVLIAVQEWARYGKQVIIYSNDAAPRTEQLGIKEADAPQRIADYWASVGRPERSGLDDIPWSAAFVSWVIQSAGVPRTLFCPSATHTIYVERIVNRSRQPDAGFIPHRAYERAPQVGDLICASRDGSGTTLDNLNRGAGHCDIVVEVRSREVHALGGNVGDSVTRSVFPLDENGILSPLSGRLFFAVIENRLP